jgi:type I restriction enzyme M protein
VITIEEARQADYNLSPSRFVSIVEEEEYRSIGEIINELERLEEERAIIESKLLAILKKENLYETNF